MIFQVYCTKLFPIKLFMRKTERNTFQNKTVIISSQSSFLSSMTLQTHDSGQELILLIAGRSRGIITHMRVNHSPKLTKQFCSIPQLSAPLGSPRLPSGIMISNWARSDECQMKPGWHRYSPQQKHHRDVHPAELSHLRGSSSNHLHNNADGSNSIIPWRSWNMQGFPSEAL